MGAGTIFSSPRAKEKRSGVSPERFMLDGGLEPPRLSPLDP